MIHIVFQQSDIDTLQQAIKLDESLLGTVYQVKDDFAVGPLMNIDTEEGWNDRVNWWKNLIELSHYPDTLAGSFDDRQTVSEIKKVLDENTNEEAWIWMGQNQHDVCGYYWLISQLKQYQGRIVILYLNNLPFINEKGQIFYPVTLHQILPKEFLKAKKLNRKVTLSEFEVDPDEWSRLCNENAKVRILEGGKKIVSKEESYFDEDIMKGLSKEWQKGNKAVGNILGKMKVQTGDIFLLWRLRELAIQDKIEINGDISKGLKDFELRIKSNEPELAQAEQNISNE